MTEENYWKEKLSREQHQSDYLHEAKMSLLIEQQEMNLFVMLKPEVKTYNGKWQVIYSKTVFGEGDTLMKAIYDFNKQFNKTI